jgi:GntR family transcriptional regulator, transcriptional repressor for pyruvate dehydrogenase complex
MAHINPALNLRDGVLGDQGAGAAIPKKDGARANLRDRIYTQIIDSIVQDEFPEQSRLPTEVELAERFGASRPTVREALSRLRSDGVIASRRGSGSYVVRKPDVNLLRLTSIESIADIQRCFVFREWVEAGAAGLAAEMRTQRDLDAIEAAYADIEKALAGEVLGVEEDLRFHAVIVKASHNQFFVSAIESVVEPIRQCMQLSRSLSLMKSRMRRDQVQVEHRAILEAITKRLPDQASEAMRLHISNARKRMFEGA